MKGFHHFLIFVSFIFSAQAELDSSIEIKLTSEVIGERLQGLQSLTKLVSVDAGYYAYVINILKDDIKHSEVMKTIGMMRLNKLNKELILKIGKPLVPSLRTVMTSKSAVGKWRTIELFYLMKEDAIGALPEIIDALKDKNKSVRYFAARAIMNFGVKAKAAVPNLIELLDDREESPREYATKALGEIGQGAESALPKLKTLLGHKDLLLALYAKKAIKKIEQELKSN